MNKFIAILALSVLSNTAQAQDVVTYPFEGSFDDATFSLESAILDKGLVIDYVAHPGAMLKRTGSDVGSTKEIFTHADAYLFCAAALSRKVMEADPLNVGHCPWSIFVMERAGVVELGHRIYPDGAMKEVEAFLASIVADATEQ